MPTLRLIAATREMPFALVTLRSFFFSGSYRFLWPVFLERSPRRLEEVLWRVNVWYRIRALRCTGTSGRVNEVSIVQIITSEETCSAFHGSEAVQVDGVLEVLVDVHVVQCVLLRKVIVVVLRVTRVPCVRRMDIRPIFAEAVNVSVVQRTKVPRESNLCAVIRCHILVALINSNALQVIKYVLIVSIDALPLISACIFVMEVARSLVTMSLPHDILRNRRPMGACLLHVIPIVNHF
jgi:hypothetical protein